MMGHLGALTLSHPGSWLSVAFSNTLRSAVAQPWVGATEGFLADIRGEEKSESGELQAQEGC